mgnify:FL=1
MRGATPYVRFGNYPVIVGLTLLLLAVGLTAILRTQRKNV